MRDSLCVLSPTPPHISLIDRWKHKNMHTPARNISLPHFHTIYIQLIPSSEGSILLMSLPLGLCVCVLENQVQSAEVALRDRSADPFFWHKEKGSFFIAEEWIITDRLYASRIVQHLVIYQTCSADFSELDASITRFQRAQGPLTFFTKPHLKNAPFLASMGENP